MTANIDKMTAGGFTLFEGLKEEPYGLLPLANLVSKGGPSSIKGYERVASYSWYLEDQKVPTLVVPGCPRAFQFFQGGLLHVDKGILIYDINHLKCPEGPLDPLILAAKHQTEKAGKSINFQDFDFVTDSVNLQKLFAFCRGEGEGLFRVDFERIGNLICMNRVENSDMVNIDYEAYDQQFKSKCSVAQNTLCGGPFFQIGKCQFGQYKMLVRYEADCVDLGPESSQDLKTQVCTDADQNAKKFAENEKIACIDFGGVKKQHDLMLMTTYPHGAGFPFFTWAQLFFSGADKLAIGWYKGRNDFSKPATYHITDINKLIKPLPYAVLSKVHDCLSKVATFLRQNSESIQVALVWKGMDFMEIYEKKPDTPRAVSKPVWDYLQSQVPRKTNEPELDTVEEHDENAVAPPADVSQPEPMEQEVS